MSRIQRAANKSGAKINLIGSRAAGTAEATSDFDYIVEGNERQIHRARSLLPRGTQGGEQSASGADTGIDVFPASKKPLDTDQPHITFTPQEKPTIPTKVMPPSPKETTSDQD
jgi:hypothetical protein